MIRAMCWMLMRKIWGELLWHFKYKPRIKKAASAVAHAAVGLGREKEHQPETQRPIVDMKERDA